MRSVTLAAPSASEGVDHEAIWAPIGSLALVAARLVPFDLIPVPPCLLRAVTGIPCPSCGGTRAFVALAHLDPLAALRMNPLVAAVGILAAVYVAHALGVWWLGWRRWRPRVDRPESRRLIRIAVVALLLLNWAYLIAVGR